MMMESLQDLASSLWFGGQKAPLGRRASEKEKDIINTFKNMKHFYFSISCALAGIFTSCSKNENESLEGGVSTPGLHTIKAVITEG